MNDELEGEPAAMRLTICDALPPDPTYSQAIFRLSGDASSLELSLALSLPERLPEDRKPASKKQLSTLNSFFWGHDVLPEACGWQQAGVLLNLRTLAWAVAETLEDGFLAANRIAIARLIAAYMSHSPYLRSVARGWSLSTYGDGADARHVGWRMLVASPFYRELFEFAEAAQGDWLRAACRNTTEWGEP